MEIERMEKENERFFLDQVKGRELEYYWFIVDWMESPERCDIHLAIEKGVLRGALLVYNQRFSQVRGDREAVLLLADLLDDDKVEITAPIGMEDIILDRFEPELTFVMLLLHVDRSVCSPDLSIIPERLTVEDIDSVIDVLHTADPRMWGGTKPDDIRESMQDGYWVGVRDEGELVAIGGSAMKGDIPIISSIAVLEPYRGRGIARSMVSAILMEMFRTKERAVIHVRENNEPARRAYEKVGYRQYGRYAFIRGKRR